MKRLKAKIDIEPGGRGASHEKLFGLMAAVWLVGAIYFYGTERILSILEHAKHLPVENLFQGDIFRGAFGMFGDIFWLIIFFGVAALSGRVLIRVFDSEQNLNVEEEVVLGLGIGLGVSALVVFFAGLSGLIIPQMPWILVLGLTFVAIGTCIKWPLRSSSNSFAWMVAPSLPTWVALAFLMMLMLMNLIATVAPPVFYDTLVYHFGLPQLYLVHHRIIPTPSNIYSGFPMNMEMLYLFGFLFRGERFATLIPWGMSIALIATIFVWAKRFADLQTGIFAALLFYTCPMVSSQIWFSLVDIGWCYFFFLAAVLALIKCDKKRILRGADYLLGIFAGFAAGTKYNACAAVLVLVGMILWSHFHNKEYRPEQGLRSVVVVIGTAALLISPYLARNTIFYSSPVFPFLNSSVDWKGLMADAHARTIAQFVATPIDIFSGLWSSRWDGSGIQTLGVAFLVFLPVIFRPKHANQRALTIALVLCWALWALSSQMPRFFLYATPLLAIQIATGLFFLNEKKHQEISACAVLLVCIVNIAQITNYWFESGSWQIFSGQQTREEYLDQGQPGYFTPYFSAAVMANKSLPQNAMIFFFKESRGYYFQRDFLASSYFVPDPMVRLINDSSSADELRGKLLNQGFTHIFVNRAELFRRGEGLNLSPIKMGLFNLFIKNDLHRVFQKVVSSPPAAMKDRQWVELYEIVRDSRKEKHS